jgi:hypothetical protein
LRPHEKAKLDAHLRECDRCDLEVNEIVVIRSTLGTLPEPRVPKTLRAKLQVKASQERRLLLEANGSRFIRWWNRWTLRLDQLMRPLTIPATGGLLSSLMLFGLLALTFSTSTTVQAYDVPVLYANRIDPNLVPVELRSSVVLTLSLDDHGHITDYAWRDSSQAFVGDPARLQDTAISVPPFSTVLGLARPTTRDISISFIPIAFSSAHQD